MCLGSRVVDGPCLVDRRGILGMRENRSSPIYAGLRLYRVRILLAVVHCFLVSEWKRGCGLVGSSTRSPPVGMFSFHSCFHFSWRLKSFIRVE